MLFLADAATAKCYRCDHTPFDFFDPCKRGVV